MTAFLHFHGHGPLVALVRGPCTGEELSRVLACPYLLASPDALFQPAGSWPVSPSLRRREPRRAEILEALEPDQAIPAERALELGLLEQVVPEEALPAAGQALLEAIIGQRDEALARAILEVIDHALTGSLTQALEQEAAGFLQLARHRFGPARGMDQAPPSPCLPVSEGTLTQEGSGWGNVPPAVDISDPGRGPLRLERKGGLATLLLSDPPRNEMNAAFFRLLARRVTQVRGAPPAAGLVVRGAGRHFSSGADLEELGRRLAVEPDLQVSRFLADNIRTFQSLATLPFVTVAAVGGCCLGSGLELALACQRRLAADNAVLALPEAQYGLMPGCGGTVRLARLLGRAQALRLIMSGRSLMASEALELGLVEAVLPRRELVPAAEAMAGGRTPRTSR